jgi:hypothetical protein
MSALNNSDSISGGAILHPNATTITRTDTTTPQTADWVNVFGPSGYDVQPDSNRNRKYGRLHLPDVLKGPNQWITDRVDGLITDATNSPFTTIILPYMYMEYPDRKIEWNVWTFDQGMASRVPYESAARTLTQRKQTFSGYTVRQGIAISMEHNFMMSPEGMKNFHSQITQVVGSIQVTNDLDVHMALLNAPSYLGQVREKYYLEDYLHKSVRDYIDMFGFVQRNMNAMDILIEDTKSLIKNWGGEEPDFLLCSGKLTFQLSMTQEKTSYMTQGLDGQKLLKDGPDMSMYRGLKIIKSKAFSLDEGSAPRDMLRRRVRVAEYYVGSLSHLEEVMLYDESADSFHAIRKATLEKYAFKTVNGLPTEDYKSMLIIRPNIEHYMLGVIIGRGGIDHLGATLWGQTEMSVFDDGQHGVWGMTYKYHERAIVFNDRNLHKVWDVAYDGYCGGKDVQIVDMTNNVSMAQFAEESNDYSKDYSGPSVICALLQDEFTWLPSPLLLCDYDNINQQVAILATADLFIKDVNNFAERQLRRMTCDTEKEHLKAAISGIYARLSMSNNHQMVKDAILASTSNESTSCKLMYQGTSRWKWSNQSTIEITGSGHHGNDYVGVTSVRNGKHMQGASAPAIQVVSSAGAMKLS